MITPFGELPDRLARHMTMQEQHDWLTRTISRRQAMAGMALGAGLVARPTLWRQAFSTGDPGLRGRHITYGADLTSELIVEFATVAAFGNATVLMGGPDGTVRSQGVEVRTVPGSSRRYCRVQFNGLPADTVLNYRIVVDGTPVGGGSARTAFTGSRPFRFTAFGDQGTGRVPRSVLRRLEQLDPMLHLMCGDLCYADSTGQGGLGDAFKPHLWDSWLDQNDPVTAHTPWLRIPGNHEMEPGFGMHGYAGMLARVSPGGSSPLAVPVATMFRVGNVGFVGLDSNDVSYEIPANRGWTGGAQTRWLRQTLAAYREPGSGINFVVAFMHHAPYSTNSTHASEGGAIDEWVPLFDEYTVDLVISGHNHCFERSKPLRAGKVVGDGYGDVDSSAGTTYITAGGGGEGGRALFIPHPNKTRVATADGKEVVSEDWSLPTKTATPSVLVADVGSAHEGGPPTMTLSVVDAGGRTLDEVSLTRGPRPGRPDRVWEPWLIGGAATAVALGGGAALARRRALPPPAPSASALSHDRLHLTAHLRQGRHVSKSR